MTEDLLATVGLYGATLIICFVDGLVPVINCELYLLGVSAWAISSPSKLPFIVALAALGQMAAKTVLYFAGLGAFELSSGRIKRGIEKARAAIERWRDKPKAVLAVSATVGLPPFYLTSLAAGGLKVRLATFFTIGVIGRAARFSLIVALPWVA
jgi:membrane protein YqaA with SNARE-associated domain